MVEGREPRWAELREQFARERAETVAAKRALLEALPGAPHDLDAAAECHCECHPSPGRDRHPGEPCMCQLTDEERKARWARAMQSLAQFRDHLRPVQEQHQRELAEAAAELGVEVREEIPAAPWVLTGAVDGRAFYMRERWDTYDIVIAHDDNPTVQPWSDPDTAGITIRSGDSRDLYVGTPPDYGVALRFIVGAIREHLARTTCPHPARAGDRYCPRCGAPLTDPAQPR